MDPDTGSQILRIRGSGHKKPNIADPCIRIQEAKYCGSVYPDTGSQILRIPVPGYKKPNIADPWICIQEAKYCGSVDQDTVSQILWIRGSVYSKPNIVDPYSGSQIAEFRSGYRKPNIAELYTACFKTYPLSNKLNNFYYLFIIVFSLVEHEYCPDCICQGWCLEGLSSN